MLLTVSKGVASLPIELLVEIGRFLAGSNSYGTLSSLSSTCKTIKQETASTLYETVILGGNRSWWREGSNRQTVLEETTAEQRHSFDQYTRQVMELRIRSVNNLYTFAIRRRFIISEALSGANHCWLFSSKIVYIAKPKICPEFLEVFGSQRNSPCRLHLVRPINAKTLADLFAIPLRFENIPILQWIVGLGVVRIYKDGQILGCLQDRHLLPLLNGCGDLSVFLSGNAPSGLENTMRQLLGSIYLLEGPSYLAWRKPQVASISPYVTRVFLHLDTESLSAFHLFLHGVSSF